MTKSRLCASWPPEQAERYWNRAVEAAHDAVEREDLRRDIAAMRAAKK